MVAHGESRFCVEFPSSIFFLFIDIRYLNRMLLAVLGSFIAVKAFLEVVFMMNMFESHTIKKSVYPESGVVFKFGFTFFLENKESSQVVFSIYET